MNHKLVVSVDEATAGIAFPDERVPIQQLEIISPEQFRDDEPYALLSHMPANTCPRSNQKWTTGGPVVPFEVSLLRALQPSLRSEGGRIEKVIGGPLDCVQVSRDDGACWNVCPRYGA